VELLWLTGRLAPDFKTIADFRRDNGKAIRRVCRESVVLCRDLNLFSDALVAIDGSVGNTPVMALRAAVLFARHSPRGS
jgi:transposase